MSLSGRQGGHQLRERDEIEDSPEIIGECSQAEFGANLLQATHQKCALIHPLFDRAKRVFDRFATSIENTRALREPRQTMAGAVIVHPDMLNRVQVMRMGPIVCELDGPGPTL